MVGAVDITDAKGSDKDERVRDSIETNRIGDLMKVYGFGNWMKD